MEWNNELLVMIIMGLILIALMIWIIHLEIRLKRLTAGKKGHSLESSITSLHKDLQQLQTGYRRSESAIEDLQQKTKNSIRSIETIRFDAFKESGGSGKQSFATAFINEQGDGVVISSLYARDRVSVYAKPLNNFSSVFELSEEEKRSITKARDNI